MTNKRLIWRRAIWLVTPFLLAYYPVLALRYHNIDYVNFATILRTLLLATAGMAVILAITFLVSRDLEKSSILAGMLAILFLSYGHVYMLIEGATGKAIQHRYLVGAELLLISGIFLLVLKKDQAARVLSQLLGTISIVLTSLILIESVRFEVNAYRTASAASASAKDETAAAANWGGEQPPDFYLIILDGYTRSDVLASRFDYDNSAFIHELSDMGFYVAPCSQSNYASTKLALSSTMYGDYIQSFLDAGGVLPSLKDSLVNQTLKSWGYKTVTFENRARGHFDLKEDFLLSRNKMALGTFDLSGGISEFEKLMIDTSFLRFVADTELVPGFNNTTIQQWDLWEHYKQTQYILSEVENVPEIPGPKFVFVHIMVPHSPFIFAPDGAFQHTNDPIAGYRSNVEFLDNHLPKVLNAILEKSHPTPVIVIMGDHGPSTRKTITHQMRMATLNAYLVNDAAREQFYPTITPVNATRIVLNAHYGTDYARLDDVSYYAYKVNELPDAEIIPNECPLRP